MAVVMSGTASPDFRSVSTARGRSSSTRSGSTCPPGRTVRSTARNPDSAMTGPTSANGSHCRCFEKTAITGSAARRGDAEAPAARDAVPSAPIVRPATAARATNSRRLSASVSIDLADEGLRLMVPLRLLRARFGGCLAVRDRDPATATLPPDTHRVHRRGHGTTFARRLPARRIREDHQVGTDLRRHRVVETPSGPQHARRECARRLRQLPSHGAVRIDVDEITRRAPC